MFCRWQNSAGIPLKYGEGPQEPSQTPPPRQRYRITCLGHGVGGCPPAAGFGGNPGDGRPGLSPAQPATVCALQYALNLSDRQASEAVRCRIDFKYALGLELEDLGCHHSVLSDFRERLAEGDRADRLPGLALTRIRRAGLLEERAARGSHLHRL
ncbi:transposase [Streptomyces sp. NPDC059753]|uniref:transposase n=1 Tax=Streptomyces sp. NPDC059753 TaxID=3346933 RepID=UPI00365DFE87